MKPLENELSLVIVGLWNRFIFNQKWVFENLADSKEARLEYPVVDLSLPYRYRFNDIVLVPGSDRLVIQPQVYSEECFQYANDLAIKIVSKLPETPYKALGFNIIYRCGPQSLAIEEMKSVSIRGFTDTLSKITLERQFIIDDKVKLNFSMEEDGDGLIVKFNYHHELVSELSVADLKDKYNYFRKRSEDMMIQVYQEELEEADNDSNSYH